MTDSKKQKESGEKKETKGLSSAVSSSNSVTNQMNLILILILGLFVFNIYMFFKVQALENGDVAGAAAGNEQAAETGANGESPLSVDNLNAYADELGLDTNEFAACLEEEIMKDKVDEDLALGQEYGVQGTPGFFINGKFLGGAFPFESFQEIIDKEIDGTATGNCSDYSADLQQYCESEDGPFNPVPQDIEVSPETPVMGDPSAPVTIIEFSDFECPFCTRAADTVAQIREAYPDQVKIYFKQFPLVNIHPNAFKAAEASLCAAEQGKFEDYHDKLFAETQ